VNAAAMNESLALNTSSFIVPRSSLLKYPFHYGVAALPTTGPTFSYYFIQPFAPSIFSLRLQREQLFSQRRN
jgi:hypothetical protein